MVGINRQRFCSSSDGNTRGDGRADCDSFSLLKERFAVCNAGGTVSKGGAIRDGKGIAPADAVTVHVDRAFRESCEDPKGFLARFTRRFAVRLRDETKVSGINL